MFKTDVMMKGDDVTDVATVSHSNNRVRVDYALQTDSAVNIPGITDSVEVNNDEWYTDITSSMQAGNVKETFYGIPLYDGPPWEVPNAGAHIYNASKAKSDLCDKLESLGVSLSTYDKNKIIDWWYISGDPSLKGHANWDVVDTTEGITVKLETLAGVNCLPVALPPCAGTKTYYSDGNWKGVGDPEVHPGMVGYTWHTSQMAAILVDRNTQEEYYMPMCPCDAQGHTYPWGVTYTSIKCVSNTKTAPFYELSQSSGSLSFGDVGSDEALKASAEALASNGLDISNYLYRVVENYGSSGNLSGKLNGRFTLKGILMYGN